MKAFQFSRYNAPLVEVDVPIPAVGEHDLLIKVSTASLNQLDEMLRVGTFKALLPLALPVTLGNDFAGEVRGIGTKVMNFSVGDVVFSKPRLSRLGSFAEFIVADESDVALKPRELSDIQAASLPLVALTAWQALVERGQVKRGDKVLIHGGAGGVGSIAIQLAKHLGAHVATTASAKDSEFVRGLGADDIIDYATADFADALHGFDFVLDTQGGETLTKSLKVLRAGGKVIGISGPPDARFARLLGLNPILRGVVWLLSSRVVRLARRLGVTYEFLFVREGGEQLSEIATLVNQGVIRPHLGRVFPFDETPTALAELAAGRLGRGKAVIDVIG